MPDRLNQLTREILERRLAELESAKEREEHRADVLQKELIQALAHTGEIDQSITAVKETLRAD